MKISQVSVLTGRAQQFLAKMLELHPILQFIEFKLDPSTYQLIKDTDTFSNSAARAEGADAQKDAQVPSVSSTSLALYSREISIDDVRKLDVHVGFAPAGLKMLADRRLSGLCVKLASEVADDIVNGAATSYEMLGLSTFVKDAAAGGQTARLGFTTAELAAMNSQYGGQIIDEADQDAFVEYLMKTLSSVPGANGIICNASMAARLSTIGKRKGAAGESVNSFGVAVPTFDRKPLIVVPDTTITTTESDGTNADCTSLFILRTAEELGVALSTNSGFYFQDFPDAEGAPEGMARMQMFLNLSPERTDALHRISRIRL